MQTYAPLWKNNVEFLIQKLTSKLLTQQPVLQNVHIKEMKTYKKTCILMSQKLYLYVELYHNSNVGSISGDD